MLSAYSQNTENKKELLFGTNVVKLSDKIKQASKRDTETGRDKDRILLLFGFCFHRRKFVLISSINIIALKNIIDIESLTVIITGGSLLDIIDIGQCNRRLNIDIECRHYLNKKKGKGRLKILSLAVHVNK